MTKYTKGEWQLKEFPSAGLQIFAEVNLGKDEHGGVIQPIYEVPIEPSLHVNKDGTVTAMIAYESWRQFPSVNFQEMQKANGLLIQAAPNMYEALKVAHDAMDELNARLGNAKYYCRFCKSKEYNGESGIVHEESCPIKIVRKALAKVEEK